MSGPKHTPWTPGPWKVLNQDLPDMRVVVTCDMPPRLVTTAAFAGDACLIAAAPRLAEELSDLAKHLEEHDPQGDVQAWLRALLDYHLPQARAALREAGVEP